MSDVLGNKPVDKFIRIQEGYTVADYAMLLELKKRLVKLEEADQVDAVRAALHVGVHADVEVTATNLGENLLTGHSQYVCIKCSPRRAHGIQRAYRP